MPLAGLVEEVLVGAGRLFEAGVEGAGGTPALEAPHRNVVDAAAEFTGSEFTIHQPGING
jgi:hypothetical protein